MHTFCFLLLVSYFKWYYVLTFGKIPFSPSPSLFPSAFPSLFPSPLDFLPHQLGGNSQLYTPLLSNFVSRVYIYHDFDRLDAIFHVCLQDEPKCGFLIEEGQVTPYPSYH